MMHISSKAGKRLAKAKAEMDAAAEAFSIGETQGLHYEFLSRRREFRTASLAVADELVAAGFADMEGD